MNYKTIESIFDLDQQSIKKYRSDEITAEELEEVILKNQNFVVDYINKHGFPYVSKTSEKAYKAAFLTILHSPDIDLIKKTISDFKNAKDDEIIKGDLAFLIDKCLVLEDKPQIYGTQYKILNGDTAFFKIEDEKNIDKLRKSMDMEIWEEYKKKI